MTWFEVAVLAIIQGLTEFLPISSSAHLLLPSQVLGWQDQGLAFDVAVHVGTLLAVVLYFRHDLVKLGNGWFGHLFGKGLNQEAKLAWFVILGTFPAGIAGLAGEEIIEQYLRSALVIALATIGFGVLLGLADRCKGRRTLQNLNWRDVIVIGAAQALALIPGTSRSGITMTAGLFLNLSRDAAARFSFLLSIPLIAAAGLLEGLKLAETGTADQWQIIVVAAILSGISAYTCIHLFLRFLEKVGFLPFVIYRLILGFGLLVWIFATSG